MTPTRRRPSHAPDGAAQHRGWLDLIEISGPFLSLPVLRSAWPTLDALEKPTREALRRAHATWRDDPDGGRDEWVRWVLTGLLGWGAELRESPDDLDAVAMDVAEHETRVEPTFALVQVGEDVKPATTRLLGLTCAAGHSPTARVPGSAWAATPVDRMAAVCRHHGVELGLVTDGRWWALVWAPKDTATAVAVFDTIAWPEAAERDVVRAFLSLLTRSRFFAVRDDETLPALLRASLGSQEDITEALGSQVREAVELLVAAFGRLDLEAREREAPSLERVDAHEVYRGAVSVMMRIVFLLFAEERRLLPADNELYASTYSAGTLLAGLEQRVSEGSEDDLEYTSVAWHRLLALFRAVHGGVDHPRLTMHAHDGSLFDPDEYPWLTMPVDDRTVLHMFKAVQTVEIGNGRLKERRTLSFRSLGVEEIGYVYEGLLAYDAFRAADVVLGLTGKRGHEAEVELRELESFAPSHCGNVDTLAADVTRRYANHGMGTAPSIAKKLKPLTGAAAEDARRQLLAAAQGDAALADRLTPFFGILRQDLRGLPLVIQPGALYVTDSPRRRNTGTHYTPRELAEEVVLHALQPLVYEPGPLQTADEGEWKLKSVEQILALNVADIAMGSAAFLVAAARYLGARLIEAWTREGDERARAYAVSDVQSEEDPVVIDARRTVIERCLYGVDINTMAVEMAKLSLWLVSMDPSRPFTFLDDRLVVGDSLLGISSLNQLEYMHLDPRKGRELHGDLDLFRWTHNIGKLVEEVAEDRVSLVDSLDESSDEDVLSHLARIRATLQEAWSKMEQVRVYADLVVGAGLASARLATGIADSKAGGAPELEAARLASLTGSDFSERQLRMSAKTWLSSETELGGSQHSPLHWPLVFPEVYKKGGFDAVIGNPPFLGGTKISGALGQSYRAYLTANVAGGRKAGGRGDLVAYFMLRALDLVGPRSTVGLIVKSSVTEGDTREIGLDAVLSRGEFRLHRAATARPWPAKSASLDYCSLWFCVVENVLDGAQIILDGRPTTQITPLLSPGSRASGQPLPLAANRARSFEGIKLNGVGFTLAESDARRMIAADAKNEEVLFPYLNGEDINARPGGSPSRWVINFFGLTESEARTYREPFRVIEQRVKPERQRLNDRGSYVLRKPLPQRYWQHAEKRPGLRAAITPLGRFLALTRHTKYALPVFVEKGPEISEACVVIATSSFYDFGLLSSSIHNLWAIARGSSLGVSVRYTPSDVYETFPYPDGGRDALAEAGRALEVHRADVARRRALSITDIYNLVSDSTCEAADISELRRLHQNLDHCTLRAYGWEGRLRSVGGTDHGFHRVGRETRYTLGSAAQREVLDSLLELNHERHADEVARGLHDKKKGGRAKKKSQDQEAMFDAD